MKMLQESDNKCIMLPVQVEASSENERSSTNINRDHPQQVCTVPISPVIIAPRQSRLQCIQREPSRHRHFNINNNNNNIYNNSLQRHLLRGSNKLSPILGHEKQSGQWRYRQRRSTNLSRRSTSLTGNVFANTSASQRRILRASEYKNLRQVVPSLKRQRDVGKVEVVTEAARYIDHLHKTLIERFILCGIPDSFKGKCLIVCNI